MTAMDGGSGVTILSASRGLVIPNAARRLARSFRFAPLVCLAPLRSAWCPCRNRRVDSCRTNTRTLVGRERHSAMIDFVNNAQWSTR